MTSSSRPTLVTIAEHLGVHYSTVSRALSPDPAVRRTVSDATVERVERAASELGYVSNRIGASLRTGRSHALGVLVPRTSEWVVGTVYEGIDATASELGYVTFVANTFDDEGTRRARIRRLSQWGVDAILYSDSRLDAEDLDPVGGVPCWPIIRRGREDHSFRVDDAAGGRLVAGHLIDSGYRDAAVICGPKDMSTFRDRATGFVDEYVRLGGRVGADRIIDSDLTIESGRREAGRLFDTDRPSAIFALHDPLALGVYVAAAERGLRIGTDVGVVGYNDVEMSAQLPVPMTSVNWKCRDLGVTIARNAIARLESRPETAEPPSPVLVPRASTMPEAPAT